MAENRSKSRLKSVTTENRPKFENLEQRRQRTKTEKCKVQSHCCLYVFFFFWEVFLSGSSVFDLLVFRKPINMVVILTVPVNVTYCSDYLQLILYLSYLVFLLILPIFPVDVISIYNFRLRSLRFR